VHKGKYQSLCDLCWLRGKNSLRFVVGDFKINQMLESSPPGAQRKNINLFVIFAGFVGKILCGLLWGL